MKKVILIPDSFKGTMSSSLVCQIMQRSIHKTFPDAEVISIPVADGGEGSVDSFLAAVGGEKRTVTVKGPYFEDMESFYGVTPDNTAVIEMAACAGLPLVGENRHAEKTTTYGVGQLILAAAQSGCKRIIVGLGGSSTNEGGTGAAAAVGVRFLDEAGQEFIPVGETLGNIAKIDMSGLSPELQGVEIITMCDIDNPLYGPNGAAHIFGPQKGADPAMVEFLDTGLQHLDRIIKRDLRQDLAQLPGAGAAGGMGCGMVAFFGSRLQMGIETVLDTVHFDDLAQGADLIFSGEGKIDSQSLRGKVVIGVARHAKALGIPLIAIVGGIQDPIDAAYEMGVSAVFSINRLPMDFSQARKYSESNLELTMDNVMRLIAQIRI